jgi:hypothetical protein
MSTNLNRRIAALEAARSPAGPVIGFWAMTEDCLPMTEEQIEKEIAVRKASAPANAQLVPITWLPPIDLI